MSKGNRKGMLEQLRLTEVGPARQLEWTLAPRLNLITGDNGLGKTFLLECAWWALTGMWTRKYQAFPYFDTAKHTSSIAFRLSKDSSSGKSFTANYDWEQQDWKLTARRNILPGLVIFAQADGSFAIWDVAKYHLTNEKRRVEGSNEGLLRLSRSEVFDGLSEEQGNRKKVLCNGLLDDWVKWQYTPDTSPFHTFTAALKTLSPHSTEEPLIPGQPMRLSWDDVRETPTLTFPYGDVPILLCSAGIQRIVTLAYILVWAWNEHITTSRLLSRKPERSIVLMIDEMEAHLHPFWQRAIVPALMEVVQALADQVQTQLLIATHSPLVLASVESLFDETKDHLLHLYLENGEVHLEHEPFVKRGRVDLWLMSDTFGLKQPRSQSAEEVIEEAKHLQQAKDPLKEDVQAVHNKLIQVLAQDDKFWPRWLYFAEQRGIRV